jgi:endonuclease-3
MASKQFWRDLYDALYALYGECECPLRHETPFQLLAAVMLSAQCRDERVNQVTEKLFAVAPDAGTMAEMLPEKVGQIIHPCGLYRNKSENLVAAARCIVDRFNGEVPTTMDELTTLPGIGRKSANVILGNAFKLPGFPVDTHVKRVLNRIGAVDTPVPEKIEAEVNQKVAPEYWCNFSHLIIQHGRQICSAARPGCDRCTLAGICKRKGIKKK